MKRLSRLVCSAIVTFCALQAHAQSTYTSNTASAVNWTSTSHWTCAGVCATGFPNSALDDVNLNGSGEVLLNSNITVKNLTITGGRLVDGWSANNYTLNVKGNLKLTGATSANSMLVMQGGNTTIKVDGDFEINESNNQTVDGDLYMYSGTVDIAGKLKMTSTANNSVTAAIWMQNNTILKIGGDLEFTAYTASGTATINQLREQNRIWVDGTSKVEMKGNIVNPQQGYLRFLASSTLELSGSVKQYLVTGYENWYYYPNVIINNTSGQDVEIKPTTYKPSWSASNFTVTNINISSSLTLSNGVVNTGQATMVNLNSITNFNLGTNATMTRTNGSLTGLFTKTGTADFTASVGGSTVKISGVTGGDNTGTGSDTWFNEYGSATQTVYRMLFVKDSPGNIFVTSGSGLHHVSGKEYWDVYVYGASPTNTNLTINYKDACASLIDDVSTGATRSLYLSRYNDTTKKWDILSASTINSGSEACVSSDGDDESGSLSVNGITTFGRFTFGTTSSTKNPLPVTLLEFNAKEEKDGVVVKWKTALEKNSETFFIERSSDGIHFTAIGEIAAQGDSDQVNEYSFIDGSYNLGRNYYRLRQVDIDDAYTLSDVIVVNAQRLQELTFHPNPVYGHESVKFSTSVTYLLMNNVGKVVIPTTTGNEIQTANLLAGIYFIKTEGKTFKLIVK